LTADTKSIVEISGGSRPGVWGGAVKLGGAKKASLA